MKYLFLLTLTLSGCATVYRYNEGQIVNKGNCTGVIKQIINNNGYLIVGCGADVLATDADISPINQ